MLAVAKAMATLFALNYEFLTQTSNTSFCTYAGIGKNRF